MYLVTEQCTRLHSLLAQFTFSFVFPASSSALSWYCSQYHIQWIEMWWMETRRRWVGRNLCVWWFTSEWIGFFNVLINDGFCCLDSVARNDAVFSRWWFVMDLEGGDCCWILVYILIFIRTWWQKSRETSNTIADVKYFVLYLIFARLQCSSFSERDLMISMLR